MGKISDREHLQNNGKLTGTWKRQQRERREYNNQNRQKMRNLRLKMKQTEWEK